MTHSEIEELLGVYALDAVDGPEALVVEEHLVDCPRCRAEVQGYRDVAALLGNAGGVAPEGLWERIAGELEVEVGELPAAPVLGILAGSREAISRETSSRDIPSAFRAASAESAGTKGRSRIGRSKIRPVAMSLGTVAAALAVVVGLLSAKVVSLDNQVSRIGSAVTTSGVAQQAAVAAADPQHRTVELTSKVGAPLASLVLLPSGRAYWITRGPMPALPSDETYQLWTKIDGQLVSIGLLGAAPRDVAVEVTSNMSIFMVTAEPLGGTVTPTTNIVVRGTVQQA